MTTTTYLGSGDASRHRRDYRPDWLENLADDVTDGGVGFGALMTFPWVSASWEWWAEASEREHGERDQRVR